MDLTKSEEKIMFIIWDLEPVSLSDILDKLPEPKPAKTTLATVLKRLLNKGIIKYSSDGRKRIYTATTPKKEVSKNRLKDLLVNYFNNSPSHLTSYFTKENKLSKKELEELKALIDKKIDDIN